MDINRNIFPIAFEPVEELIDAAYISDDFTLADAAIARNTVKETNMISRLDDDARDFELAECFGIYITQDSYEQFGRDSDGLEIDGVIQPERRGTECKLSSDER